MNHIQWFVFEYKQTSSNQRRFHDILSELEENHLIQIEYLRHIDIEFIWFLLFRTIEW